MTTDITRTHPADRFRSFARYVKNYMAVAATLTAAMPVGIAQLGAIPMYRSLERVLAAYSSLFCFLIFAYVFFIRHSLARVMFRGITKKVTRLWQVVPLLLLLLAMGSGIGYLALLQRSIQAARDIMLARGVNSTSMADVLVTTDYIDAPYAFALIALYLGIFVFAECAFAIMATREYLQDALALSDPTLIG
jgi:hypothetical protein